jgi:hypothetical protein
MDAPRIAPPSLYQEARAMVAGGERPQHPDLEPLDTSAAYELRWRIHLLDLMMSGFQYGPNMIEHRDLEAVWGLVSQMRDLAPWQGFQAPEPKAG